MENCIWLIFFYNFINKFFIKYQEIKGDKEYIAYKIKELIVEDRKFLNRLNGEGQHPLNILGKVRYCRHYVIPEQNNGKEYYIYCINTFIWFLVEFCPILNTWEMLPINELTGTLCAPI